MPSSPMPSTQQSLVTNQSVNDSIDNEQTQNNNGSSDEESFVSSASKSISKTKSKKATPSKTPKDKRKLDQSKEIPDENENCRVSILLILQNNKNQ